MAAWCDNDERDLRLESYGLDVSPHAFYEWDGVLDDVTATAELLMVDTESLVCESLCAGLRLIDEIVDREAAA